NTQAQLPPDLRRAGYVVRLHHRIDDLFPKTVFRGSTGPDGADQLHFFKGGGYQSHFLLEAGSSWHRWVAMDNALLEDSGPTIIPPGRGGFFRRNGTGSGDILTMGRVRQNAFVQNLDRGYNLISEGFPFRGSPESRALLQENGFLPGHGLENADQLQIWSDESFIGYFLFSGEGLNRAPSWIRNDDVQLTDRNREWLFEPQRAAFLHLLESDHPFYRVPYTGPTTN
ncbi:MAG: hypothetical protein AAF514_08615, partial [Verrucomicrobiota bacterium]